MTNKELQEFLKLWDEGVKIPDPIAIQIVNLSPYFYKEHCKKIEKEEKTT